MDYQTETLFFGGSTPGRTLTNNKKIDIKGTSRVWILLRTSLVLFIPFYHLFTRSFCWNVEWQQNKKPGGQLVSDQYTITTVIIFDDYAGLSCICKLC